MDDREGVDVKKSTCSEASCDRVATVRGICGAHYQQQRRQVAEPCSITDCNALQRAGGLCAKHHARYRRHGTTDGPRAPEKTTCGIESCRLPSRSRGWCNFHYRRWVLTGDPLGTPPSQKRKEAAQAATSKTCTKCQHDLPLEEFAPRAGMADGRRSECHGCTRKYHKERHARERVSKVARPPALKVQCKAEHCERFAHSRGWCKGHYERWRRSGSPEFARVVRAHRTEDELTADSKTCPKCHRKLPVDHFNGRTDSPDGLQYVCRRCLRNAKVSKRYAEDRDFRDQRAEYHRRYRQKYREDMQERQRAAKLWINYGMTLGEYEAMYRDQGGVCKICGSGPHGGPEWARKQWLSVDHCHDTGRIRGLLCDNCNIGLGKFNDNVALLTAATDYLAHTSAATP